jgi:hypothetical protein
VRDSQTKISYAKGIKSDGTWSLNMDRFCVWNIWELGDSLRLSIGSLKVVKGGIVTGFDGETHRQGLKLSELFLHRFFVVQS